MDGRLGLNASLLLFRDLRPVRVVFCVFSGLADGLMGDVFRDVRGLVPPDVTACPVRLLDGCLRKRGAGVDAEEVCRFATGLVSLGGGACVGAVVVGVGSAVSALPVTELKP